VGRRSGVRLRLRRWWTNGLPPLLTPNVMELDDDVVAELDAAFPSLSRARCSPPDNDRDVRVRLLGGFEVDGVAERALGSRKARTLLKLLALRNGTPVSGDVIAEVLWPDHPPARPAEQIGVLVSRLRGVVGTDRIRRTDAGYALDVEWTDLAEVEALTSAAVTALAEGRVTAARAASRSAVELVRGRLLGDEDGEWIETARASASPLLTRAHRVALDAAAAAGDSDDVVALAERVLTVDPYDEVVLRALMKAHLAARRPASALSAYARLRARLAEDLGVPPTAETEALHDEALLAADGDRPTDEEKPPSTNAADDLVGRGEHLAVLTSELARARSGETRTVVIEGNAGMGKTALVGAWLGDIPGDVVVVRGRCDELGRDLPLQPVADALAEHLRGVGAEAAEAIMGVDAAVLVPLVGPISHQTSVTAVTDADEGRARVYAAVLAAIARAAGNGPIVVVVEDLHLADPSTIGWIAFAQRRLSAAVLVLTTRERLVPPLTATARLTVGPLSFDEVGQLVGRAAASDVFDRTGGHPLLVRALTASGAVTLEDAVAAQTSGLDDEAARSLRVAAVAGLECDPDLLASVTGSSTLETILHLEQACATGLVVASGAAFRFRHEIIRQAAEQLSTPGQRAAAHSDIAHALARRTPTDHLAVAVHARAGGAPALASRAYVAAAEAAAARFDLDAAEDHLAAAIEAAPDAPEPLVTRARLQMSRTAFDDAARTAAEAVARGGGAAALEVAGWIAYYRRRYDEARVVAEQVLAETAADDPLRVSAAALAGRVRHGAGDLRGAIDHLSAAGNAPLPVRGVADVWLAQARLHEGRPADALAALARPLLAPDSLAHPWAPLHLRFNRAMALGQLGRVGEALTVAADLVAVAAEAGAVGTRFTAPAANVTSWLLRWSGRGEAADEENERALEATGGRGPSAEGFAEGHYVALLDLADGRLLADDPAGVEGLLPRLAAIDGWTGTMSWHQRHRLALIRARLALAAGERDRAAELASAVAEDAAERGASRYELLALAHVGVADPAYPPARLQPVVEGLTRCAALDGWPLLLRLGRERGIDGWVRMAERMAAAMVATCEPRHAPAARAFVDRLVSG